MLWHADGNARDSVGTHHGTLKKGADINFGPFGTLKLDPGTMFIFGMKKATSGIDGLTVFDVAIPNDPRFLGLMVHWQALNVATIVSQPRLTNLIITTIQ
jgi:hypothetical protein